MQCFDEALQIQMVFLKAKYLNANRSYYILLTGIAYEVAQNW